MSAADQEPEIRTELPADSRAFRRIAPAWYVTDGSGYRRVSSQAFQDKDGAVSVGLECIMAELRLPPDRCLQGHAGYGLTGLGLGFIGGLGLETRHEPTTAEAWHGGIHGKKTGGIRSKLAKAATEGLIVLPRTDDGPLEDLAPTEW
jgi:hypothetical protein